VFLCGHKFPESRIVSSQDSDVVVPVKEKTKPADDKPVAEKPSAKKPAAEKPVKRTRRRKVDGDAEVRKPADVEVQPAPVSGGDRQDRSEEQPRSDDQGRGDDQGQRRNQSGRGRRKGGNDNPNREGRSKRRNERHEAPISDEAKGVTMNLREVAQMEPQALLQLGESLDLENVAGLRKAEQVFTILKAHAQRSGTLYSEGVLEILPDGYGFLRSQEANYLAGPDDVYVSVNLVRRFSLRKGDTVAGEIKSPREGERYFALKEIDSINGENPAVAKTKVLFDNLTPLYPDRRLKMEVEGSKDITGRVIDIVSPIGGGQRALLVAPPRTGKTMMMQSIAHSIEANHPEVVLMVLLIDERPEEVTDMKRSVKGEVISSTFDEPAQRHVQVAEMVIEKAKRQVEHGRDVVILLDSITRLARAYNTVVPSSGKILSGGVDSNALHRPKRFFGAARNIEGGGSLTIIATALVDTGSKMDEVIFEEFKGTGNMEINLNRKLVDKRVFPAIDIAPSGTRKEELLVERDTLQKIWVLRKILSPMGTVDAMEFMIDKLGLTKNNDEFFDKMNQ